jgi:hypothetical protein
MMPPFFDMMFPRISRRSFQRSELVDWQPIHFFRSIGTRLRRRAAISELIAQQKRAFAIIVQPVDWYTSGLDGRAIFKKP